MNKAIITTSWDDGHPLNLKLGKLLEKYKIPATFYISLRHEGLGRSITNVKYLKKEKYMTPDQIRKIAKNFDVGGHTLSHTDLTNVSLKMAKKEILEGKRKLENIIGKKIISFSYPWGDFNQRIIYVLKKLGFKGARTIRLFTRTVNDPFKMGTMIHAAEHSKKIYTYAFIRHMSDFKLSYFILKNYFFNKPWDEIAIKTLKFVIKNGGIWHLWGHSWEIDKYADWERLENVFRIIKKEKNNVELMDNSQLLLEMT